MYIPPVRDEKKTSSLNAWIPNFLLIYKNFVTALTPLL